MKDSKGTLYLIPMHLGEYSEGRHLPNYNLEVVNSLSHFVVENERSARRFLRSWGYKTDFEEVELFIHDKRQKLEEMDDAINALVMGNDVGMISEAGCPGIADPGQEIIAKAHEFNITVEPLIGPSSILLAMMASGLNGQSFAFNGYLPIDKKDRVRRLKDLERLAAKTGQSQIFMETPYRNMALFEDIRKHLNQSLRLCVAAEISTAKEEIRTMTVGEWKTSKINLHKRPSIFIIGR